MSEHTYVGFRAVDGPLNDEQLAFAERQSSRAEITRWSFEVEYHYGDFGGDVDEMLRQGYDVFLHYANFGVREIKLRLPHGLPGSQQACLPYIDGESIHWLNDKQGNGGILALCPCMGMDGVDPYWDFDDCIGAATYLREQLMTGDLRPLYLCWACGAEHQQDYDWCGLIEPPTPHGIDEMKVEEILRFFDLDPWILKAAGEQTPSAPSRESKQQSVEHWLGSLDAQQAKNILREMLTSDTLGTTAKVHAEILNSQHSAVWPTTEHGRTYKNLMDRAEVIGEEEIKQAERKAAAEKKKQAELAERERQERMKQIEQNPQHWLVKAKELVEDRGTANYEAAAEILAELRDALGGDEGENMARDHAAQLVKAHPTLNHLKKSLRQRGLRD